jgi:prevent-host-death family protein
MRVVPRGADGQGESPDVALLERKSYSGLVRRATITETKNRLSALLDRVRHGETILVMDRGRPVARIEPAVTGPSDDADGRLARLERRGIVRRALAPPPKALILRRFRGASRVSGVLAALLAERRRGR